MKKLKDFIEGACDQYCESLTDQEFRWLVEGLTEKFEVYLKNIINELCEKV